MSSATREVSMPAHFLCPISLEPMQEPVTAASGITYDRRSIETWLGMGNSLCPVTNQPISPHHPGLVPNHTIRVMIQEWCAAHKSVGVGRVPVTRLEAVEVLSGAGAAAEKGDGDACGKMVEKVGGWARESERSKGCLRANGAGAALAKCFRRFSQVGREASNNVEVLEQILTALATMLPMDSEAGSIMGTSESLRSLAWILNHGSLGGRVDAVRTVRDLVRPGKNAWFVLPETNAVAEALLKLLKEPISSQATKAALLSVSHLVSAATTFVELGIVRVVVEILVDCEKSVGERCLGVLDGICEEEAGRVAALGHELTVAVLVKNLLRVSDAATELAASVLWKMLCRSGSSERCRWCVEEALQVGALQKLLLVLQVGCGVETKAKVSETLRTLNANRAAPECVESLDFKCLKRSF